MHKKPLEYNKLLLDHYRNPRNFGKLSDATHTAEVLNRHCGDEVKLFLKFEGGIIKNARHTSRGCTLTIASASVLAERIKGVAVKEAQDITLSDIKKWLGVSVEGEREQCMEVSLRALAKALEK